MADTTHYRAVIIGAGQAGVPLATALAGAGWKTALVEREHLGGTCINYGCVPTKTMVASARVAYLARRASDYGVQTGPVSVDMEKVRQRKRAIVESFRGGSQRRVEQAENLELLMGEACFSGPLELVVRLNSGETRRLTADTIFINTGARPSDPRIAGLDSVPTLDSTSIMELDEVPEHLLVLGGGYIGLEFGQMFRRFGSRVTVIQRGPRLLPREDEDVAHEIAAILREDGLDLRLETATRQAAMQDGRIVLNVVSGGSEQQLGGTHLLLAGGRTPNTENLNLAAAGIQPDKNGFVPVNQRLETAAPGIYALGDVKGGPAFTHISYDDFRIIRSNLLEDAAGHRSTRDRPVPYTVFIDPQLGRIGLTETEARAQGLNIRVARMPMNWVARALEVDESRGFIKAVVEAESGRILGCAVLGLEGGELMAVLQVAMLGNLPYTVLRDTIFAHPTLAESLNNLFSSWV